jgi:hypothetical protein
MQVLRIGDEAYESAGKLSTLATYVVGAFVIHSMVPDKELGA